MEGGNADAPAKPARFAALRARLAPASPWGPPLEAALITKAQRRVPAVAGTLAATTALLAVLILRFNGVGIFLPETAVEWVVDHIPGALEATAIGLMGGFAKVLALAAAIVGFVVVHGFFALYYPRVEEILGDRWKVAAVFAGVPAAVTLLVVLPFFGAGVAGSEDPRGAGPAIGSVIAGSVLYALVLDVAFQDFTKRHPQGIDLTRRTAIQGALILLLAASLGTAILSSGVTRAGRFSYPTVSAMRGREITPTEEFYVVSKNLMSPTVDPSSWSLTVDGLVDQPFTLSSNELLARTQTEEVATLECVSNQVGGNLISSGRWRGVPFSELLAEAGVRPQATWVLFTCYDGYTVGVPLLRAQAPGALLALHLNGERLTRDHGFPARILMPNLYGMMNPKWLTKITLVDHEVSGYWQQKGWTNDARIRPQAIIAVAPQTAQRGLPAAVGGVAFAGNRRITRVEVSDDGGSTWASATLDAPLSENAWTLWSFDWNPRRTGALRLAARAYFEETPGGAESLQPTARESPFPNGASGIDEVAVTVTA
jgi:DMSO/TMAO reductase YedYZ molybdopterin-dependent catalytic subunit